MGKLLFDHGAEIKTEFWEIWTRERDYLFQLCLKWMGNPQDAEDALSSAMIKAYEKLPRFMPGIITLKGWLTRFTHNHCMDLHRQARRRPGAFENIDEVLGRDREGPGMTESPEDEIVRREMYSSLRKAIDSLPDTLKQPITLRCFQELPYRQIAKELKLTPENARKRVQRARKVLSEKMEQTGEKAFPKTNSQAPFEFPDLSSLPGHEIPNLNVYPHCLIVKSDFGLDCQLITFLKERPKRLEQKQATLRNYVQNHPGGWKKRKELALVYIALGNWASAKQELIQVLEKRPDQVAARLRLIEINLAFQNPKQAIKLAREGATTVLKASSIAYFQGMAKLIGEDGLSAIDRFREGSILEPENPIHGQGLALALKQEGLLFEALEVQETLLGAHPEDVTTIIQYSQSLLEALQLERALSVLRHGLKVQPSASLLLIKAKALEGTLNNPLLKKILKSHPNTAETASINASLLIQGGKTTAALQLLENLCHQLPSLEAAKINYLQFLFHWGPKDKAGKYLRNILPQINRKDLLRNLAAVLMDFQLDSACRKALLKKTAFFPNQGWHECLFKAKLLFESEKNSKSSQKWIEKAVQMQPRLPACLIIAAELSLISGLKKSSREYAKTALNHISEVGHGLKIRAHLCLARTCFQEERQQHLEAIPFHASRMVNPMPGMSLFYRGEAAAIAGDHGIAEEYHSLALKTGLPFPWKNNLFSKSES